jgi:hypothetical protein
MLVLRKTNAWYKKHEIQMYKALSTNFLILRKNLTINKKIDMYF